MTEIWSSSSLLPRFCNLSQDTINKPLLLNWLYSSDKDLPLEELGKWIAAKTDGKYSLVKKQQRETSKSPR